MLPSFIGSTGDPSTFDVILLNDIMDLHMSRLGTIVPGEPCCEFYATKRQVL